MYNAVLFDISENVDRRTSEEIFVRPKVLVIPMNFNTLKSVFYAEQVDSRSNLHIVVLLGDLLIVGWSRYFMPHLRL
jgi:hypothetical protein